MRRCLAFLLPVLTFCTVCRAMIMPDIYSENMMIQAGKAFYIKGWAKPFAEIKAEIEGLELFAKAEEDGKWKIKFPAFARGSCFDILLKTADEDARIIRNVLAGDIWFCSGQSNMEMKAGSTDVGAALRVAGIDNIRYFIASNQPSEKKVEDLKGKWVVVNQQNYIECSALALSFGYYLVNSLDYPVGLIVGAVGGTPIESWTQLELLKSKDYNRHIFQERELWKKNRAVYLKKHEEKRRQWEERVRLAKVNKTALPSKVFLPFELRENWEPGCLYNAIVWPLKDFVIKGVLWYQGESNTKHPFVYRYQLADLVHCWRETFNAPGLPFFIVQLPEFNRDPGWKPLQESQAAAAKLNNCGLIVAVGLGDSLNIHPRRKMELGRRAASRVLHEVYNDRQEGVL